MIVIVLADYTGTRKQALPTARGFEPLRAEPNGFLVHHLNHSVTLSCPASHAPTYQGHEFVPIVCCVFGCWLSVICIFYTCLRVPLHTRQLGYCVFATHTHTLARTCRVRAERPELQQLLDFCWRPCADMHGPIVKLAIYIGLSTSGSGLGRGTLCFNGF